MKELWGFVLLLIAAAIYFAPCLLANVREHNNLKSIVLLNLFFGWTGIGWVASLIWAYSDNARVDAPTRSKDAPYKKGEPWRTPPLEDAMKKCPFCAEDIKASAVKCKHCGSDL